MGAHTNMSGSHALMPKDVNNDAIVVPMKSGIISVGGNAEVPSAQIKRELSSR